MCKRIIIYFFFFFITLHSYTQIRTNVPRSELDSLIRIIPDFRDEELVDHLNLIATSISQRYPDSCLYYAQHAFNLSESLNYEYGKTEAKFNSGNGYYFKNDVKNSMRYYFESLAFIENEPSSKLQGNLYSQIGLLHYYNFNFIDSKKYFIKAENIFHSINDDLLKYYAQRMIFHAFLEDSLDEEALKCVVERLDYFKLIDPKNYNRALNEMGLIYLNLHDSSALKYFTEGMEAAKKSEVLSDQSVLADNIGCFYANKPNQPDFYEIAEKHFKIALRIEDTTDRYALKASYLMDYGNMCLKYDKLKKADSIYSVALKILQQFDSTLLKLSFNDPSVKMRDQVVYKSVKLTIYKGYVKLFLLQKNYEKAFEYEVLKNELKEWIQANKDSKELELIEATYEASKISQKIELLSKENELNRTKALQSTYFIIGLGLLLVIAILIAFLLIRQNRIKTQQEKTILQQKLLRSQMNPHFIFNSLASIQNAIINEEPKKASKYLAKFSRLVRNILDSSVEEFIPLEQEISTIENYLGLQKIRFPEKFDYTLEVDDRLNPASVRIPPMLAQPFIENAIEHGIKHKNSKGKIDVRFKLQNGRLELEVEDDGIGRQRALEILREQDQGHKSMATTITHERIGILNNKLKGKILMEIIDLKNTNNEATGTKVRFKIPINN